MLERIQQKHEKSMLRIRQAIAMRKFKQEESDLIIEKIMNRMPKDFSKFISSIHNKHNDEILRRFSVLTREFVTTCVHRALEFIQLLGLVTSDFQLIHHAIEVMKLHLILIPEFSPIVCTLVRQRITETIFKVVNDLKTEHLNQIRNKQMCIISKSRGIDPNSLKSTQVVLINIPDDDSEDIQLPTNTYENFTKNAFERKREMFEKENDKFVSCSNKNQRLYFDF